MKTISLTNKLGMLSQRRFGPFFGTQFMNALNDNVYKSALIFLFSMQAVSGDPIAANTLINVCAAVLIIPFILFSGYAGQLSDKYDKAIVIRYVKLLEVGVALFAAIGFYLESNAVLIAALFLIGAQSALFSPVKYSILPHHLNEDELMRGNGLMEMGTFVAILIGTIIGTMLMSNQPSGAQYVSVAIFIVAALGWIFCLRIPKTKPSVPDLEIYLNPFRDSWEAIRLTVQNRTIFLTVLAISWFWLFSSVFLAQIPSYTLVNLGGNEEVVSAIFVTFAFSIGVGCVLCDKISNPHVELGLIPFGLIGLTFFMFDFSIGHTALATAQLPLRAFIKDWHNIRIFIDCFGMGLFCGFYLVPLYTLIQRRTPQEQCSRVIAGNNIFNALFMVVASIFAIVMIRLKFNIADIFFVTASATLCLGLVGLRAAPEFILRFLAWILVNTLYRVDKKGLDQIPENGPAIIVCNHVSFLDPVLIIAYSRRPIRFIMWYTYHHMPILGFLFKTAKTIPIAGDKECPETKQNALEQAVSALERGELVGIFPEGTLTKDGELGIFRGGITQILERAPVPVIPIAVKGLWGSFFSCKHGRVMLHFPRNWFKNKIGIVAGEPISPDRFDLDVCKEEIQRLKGDHS